MSYRDVVALNSILFVCTGNTCRSPMAEGIARKIFAQKNLNIKVASAGIMVGRSEKPSKNAIDVMKKMDIDISKHISQSVDKKMIDDNEIILTMADAHRKYLRAAFPYDAQKMYTLAYFACKDNYDIIDPFGGSLDVYQKCADELCSLINILSQNIISNKL